MLDKLISSKARLNILLMIFKNPDKKYYARELVKLLNLDQANVHKELINLTAAKILNSVSENGKKYFYANKEGAFFSELESMIKKDSNSNQDQEIFCLEEMPNYYPMFTSPAWNAQMCAEFSQLYGFKTRLKTLVTIFENNLCQLLSSKKDFYDAGAEIFNRVKDDPQWRNKYISDLKINSAQVYQTFSQLRQTNLKPFSDLELASLFEKFFKVYKDLHKLHIAQTVLDFGEGNFSKYLMSYLEKKTKQAKLSLGDVFSTLTTPLSESKSGEEYRALLLILKDIMANHKIKKYFSSTESRIIVAEIDKLDSNLANKLKKHADIFGSLGYGMVGPGWDQEYFIDILSSLIRQNINPDKALLEAEKNRLMMEKKQREFEKKLAIDTDHLGIFNFARDLVFTKGLRKDAMFYAIASMESFFKEVGRRRYLSLRQIRYMNPEELVAILKGENIPAEVLNERYNFSVYYSIEQSTKNIFLAGDKGRAFVARLNILKEDIVDVKFLAGDCASPGRARGEAKIINVPADIKKMKDGDILVSIATTPDLVPAIKKASAIVTDMGGITCHAAIISRELGIPCVVGTRISTKVIKDGMMVDVDATHGKVNIIS